MSNIDKRPYRADGGDIGTGRIREIADNPYGDEEKCWLAKRVIELQSELKFEHEQNVIASRALITQHVRANETEARIAETENDKSRMVDAMYAAVALNSAGISLYDFDECVSRLHEWGALPDYCIALYVDFIHGFVSENKLLDFGYINDNGAFAARQAEKRIAELERDVTQLIEERDSAEKALADMYEAAMGERPEWSNLFGYAEAIDDVAQHVNFLDIAAVTGKGE